MQNEQFSQFFNARKDPLLQHGRQTFPKHILHLLNPPQRLPFDAFIIIFLQLADKGQHLRQQGQPLFPETIRQAALALHRRQSDGRDIGSRVLQDAGIERFMVMGGIGRDG